MQEAGGVQTCRFHQMKKAAFRLPRSFGGDKRDRTADLSGGKRRKARRRRVLIEMQEVSGVRTAHFTKQKTEDKSPRFLLGGDKRDRTADLSGGKRRKAAEGGFD